MNSCRILTLVSFLLASLTPVLRAQSTNASLTGRITVRDHDGGLPRQSGHCTCEDIWRNISRVRIPCRGEERRCEGNALREADRRATSPTTRTSRNEYSIKEKKRT